MAYLPPGGGRMNVTIGSNTAGVGSLISTGTMALAGGNNITLSQNGANGITFHGAGGGAGISAAGASASNGTVAFSNSNNVSFGMNGSTVTASASFNQTAQTQSNIQAIYDGANSISTGTIRYSNANGISFGINGQTLTGSHNGLTSQSNQAFSAAGGSSAFQTLSFSNANGVSFTNNAGQVGASVATTYAASNHSHGNPTLNLTNISGTTASASNGLTLSLSAAPGGGAGLSAGTQSVSTGTVNFANSNGITFGMSGSNQITASHNGLTNMNLSAGTTSNNLSNVSFADSNGVSFGLNGSTVTATVATTYAASNHSHGNPTLNLTNISGTTASASNGLTLSLSAASQTVQTQSRFNLSVGGNSTSAGGGYINISSGQMLLAGGNNITLSQNGNSVSIVGGAGGGGIALANSQTTYTSGTANLIEGGGAITIASTTGQKYNFSVPATSSMSVTGALSLSVNGSTISLGAPAFSVGMSNSTYGGATGGTSGTASNRLIIAAGSNITLSQSTGVGGNTLAIYAGAGGGGGGAAFSAGTQSVNTGTVKFANSNGITFGMSGSSQITASHNALTSQSNQVISGTVVLNEIATNMTAGTLNASNLLIRAAGNVSAGLTNGSLYLYGNPGIALSAGASDYTSGLVEFVQSGAITITPDTEAITFSVPNVSSLAGTGAVSISTSGSTISIGAPVQSAQTANLYVSSNTTQLSSTAGVDLRSLTFQGAGDISVGVSGGKVLISGSAAGGGGGGATLSYYNPQDAYLQVTGQQGQGTLHIQPTPAPNVTFDRVVFPIFVTGSTASTASVTMSMHVGIFTRNASTLSLSTSFSASQAITHSGTANSSQNIGLKLFTMAAAGSLSEGQYYFGIMSRTTSGGAAAVSISQQLASQGNTGFAGLWGVASNATMQYTRGLGAYSASTSGMPSSVAFSQIQGTNSLVLRQPLFYLVNGTV